MFLFLQEYCKFKNTEDGAFPSVYIGLKDKLSGIHKVIMDSTALLIQLLQSYKEKLQEFSKDGETPGLVTSLEGLAGELGVRKGEKNRGGENVPFSEPSSGWTVRLVDTYLDDVNLQLISENIVSVCTWPASPLKCRLTSEVTDAYAFK